MFTEFIYPTQVIFSEAGKQPSEDEPRKAPTAEPPLRTIQYGKKPTMSDDEAAEKIKSLSGDPEMNHGEADDLLCEILKSYGYAKTVEAFKSLEKWYA